MAPHPNAVRLRRAEDVRQAGTFKPEDIAVLEDFLHEDIVWHGFGDSVWAEGARGRDQVIGLFKMFKQFTGGTMRMSVKEVFADDVHGVVLVDITAERDGKSMLLREVNLFHFDEDGKATEFWGIPVMGDPAIMDEFWSDLSARPDV